MAGAPDTELVLEGFVIPLRAAVSYEESWEGVGDPEVFTRWDGVSDVIAPLYNDKFTIVISASGDGVWRIPAFGKSPAGKSIRIHSRYRMSDVIPAGFTSVVLARDFVEADIRVVIPDTDDDVPFGFDGRTITIPGALEGPVVVIYRPIFDCWIVSANPVGASGTDGTSAWLLRAVEKVSPP